MSEPCTSLTRYFHEGGVGDSSLAPLLNRLEAEGWEDIEWEKEQAEKEVHQETTYRVDAQMVLCTCKPKRRKVK